jgi:cystathionine beta-lyase/cystathionine gamma-synthase
LILIDNCFATLICNNQSNGSVVHSATKLMDGQGRVLGGVTVGDQIDSENLFIQPIDGTFIVSV